MGFTKPPIQWILQSFPCGETAECELYHFVLYSAYFKNECSYTISAPVYLHVVRWENRTIL
jgi:hypothetical protein